eukprot:gnl/Hemi2/7569_TR2602_c0_g1_i1.p1 gnl/Hemi2/7569_TR2602_c0_g1~~gnl/Hemi2/7569_TR2602_c0_g1_i1.p1  ORF type:complete len:492 (+),score=140.28 gnl/Hemi2/7569_TR2602_c0_g1_i1:132-1478(+)
MIYNILFTSSSTGSSSSSRASYCSSSFRSSPAAASMQGDERRKYLKISRYFGVGGVAMALVLLLCLFAVSGCSAALLSASASTSYSAFSAGEMAFDTDATEYLIRQTLHTTNGLRLSRVMHEQCKVSNAVQYAAQVVDSSSRQHEFTFMQPVSRLEFHDHDPLARRAKEEDELPSVINALSRVQPTSTAVVRRASQTSPLMPDLTVHGPMELVIKGHEQLYQSHQLPRLLLPHPVDAGAVRKIVLDPGCSMTLRGLYGVSLSTPIDLLNVSDSLSSMRLSLARPVQLKTSQRMKVKRLERDAVAIVPVGSPSDSKALRPATGLVPIDMQGADSFDNLLRSIAAEVQSLLGPGVSIRKISNVRAKAVLVHSVQLELIRDATVETSVWEGVVLQDSTGYSVASFEQISPKPTAKLPLSTVTVAPALREIGNFSTTELPLTAQGTSPVLVV